MALLGQSSDYTDKDFESIRKRAFDLIRSVFPTWTNEAVANFGNILVEGYSWILDVLTFYQDQQAREGRFQTAVLRKSVIALCKLIGYELPGANAATADIVITIQNANALTGTVVPASVNTPVVISTQEITDPIKGEIISPLPFQIDVATGSGQFVWEHSITQPTYTRASTSLADQSYLLPFGPFLDDSEEVSTVSQGTFTKVESFFNSGPTDAHYRIQVDQNDKATAIFGDNINGIIPSGTININYRAGGGIYGNVEQNSLVKVEGTFVDSIGNKAYLVAENTYPAEGGLPREEIGATKINAPESIRVLNRTVAREDYEINAKRVLGIGRALMLTSNEDVTVSENYGKLYIIPSTGGVASQALLDEVETMCTVTYPNTITFQLEVLTAVYQTIDVQAVVWLRQNQTASTVKDSIIANLEDYFEPMLASGAPNSNVDFGFNYKDVDGNPAGEIAFSDIFNEVRDTTGVRKVGAGDSDFTLNGLRDDVSISNWKFPSLGQVIIIDGDTGTEI
jgi:hypothetical protein